MFLQSVYMTIVVFIFSLIVMFITVNLVIGCNDWSESNCVTPYEFMNILVK